MSIRLLAALATGALLAGAAFAQTQERTLYFEPTIATQGATEIVNAIRTVTETPQLSIDDAHKSLTLRGTAAQVKMAEWLFEHLNRPSGGTPSFTVPDAPEQMLQVFYLANVTANRGVAEMVNTIRTVVEVQRMMACQGAHAIAMRVTAGQAALAEWLVNSLDKPDGWQPAASQNPAVYPDASADTVRVFYMTHVEKPQDIAEVVNLTRTLAAVQRMFAVNEHRAVVLRGAPNQIALALWLLNALDKPAGWPPPSGQNPASYQYQDDTRGSKGETDFVRIFYLAPNVTQEGLAALTTQIRVSAGVQRMFASTTHHAVALLGTASQVTAAEQLVAARQ
jgi:uncharacterized cupredoxin-like copper-binding protein